MRRALAIAVLAAACSKGSPAPIHQLRFRGEGTAVAAAPGGGAVIAGGFAVETDLGAGVLRAGDDRVHGVVAWIDRDGKIAWDAMLGGPFVKGLAVDGDDVLLVAQAMPENRAWRIGPGGGETWSVSFGGAAPHASAWRDDGTLYVVGGFEGLSQSTGALGLAPADPYGGWIAAIDRAGKVRWAKLLEATASPRYVVGVAVTGDREVVISTANDALIVDAYDRAGARVATRTLPGGDVGAEVAPLGDGVVLGVRGSRLIALDRALATRWERELDLPPATIATGADGIFIGGATFGGVAFGGTTIPRAGRGSIDAYVARLTLDGDPDWISIGRGAGEESTHAIAASGDVVWATGGFHGPLTFGTADPLRGEPDGIQSGFAIELAQTR